ncbi:MAG TPA: hypothetical protein VGJ02_03375, partial [Pyrinomonadaceae bacterium]
DHFIHFYLFAYFKKCPILAVIRNRDLVMLGESAGNEKGGCWQLAVGSWQLAVGSWQLAVGSWQLAVNRTGNCQPQTN